MGDLNHPIIKEYKDNLTKYNDLVQKAKEKSWNAKCEEIDKIEDCARLNKLLSKEPKRSIAVMKKSDNSLTSSVKENLSLLLDTHFPESILDNGDEVEAANNGDENVKILETNREFASKVINMKRVGWAIRSFKPYKSPGPDGVYPALLQHGLDILGPNIVKLCRASIVLGLIPSPWSKVEVKFLPKPGQDSYDTPKSYRPISLLSFILKCLEKLVDRHIREGALLNNPIHHLQFAYLPGKSTDAALHKIVSKIEKTLDNSEFALGGFVDIEGAFNNTDYSIIRKACEKHNIEKILIDWIIKMLESRRVYATLYDETVWIKPTRGTPQGGCISCLLWTLVINSLLEKLNGLGYYAIGYADDIVVYTNGRFKNTVIEMMQLAFKEIEKWCKENKLSVNPKKNNNCSVLLSKIH